jgi:hypothetical protein
MIAAAATVTVVAATHAQVAQARQASIARAVWKAFLGFAARGLASCVGACASACQHAQNQKGD